MWVGQGLLAVAVIVFVTLAISRNWERFRTVRVELVWRPLPILAAGAAVLLSYAVLIEAWRRVLRGWQEHLRFAEAARIWCLSNLGRYLPGKVWSIAGLTVLAKRAGVGGWQAAGAAVSMQALAIGTGASVAAVATPGTFSAPQLAVAALMTVGTFALLSSRAIGGAVARLLRARPEFRILPFSTIGLAGGIALASWLLYGLAFWLLAHGLLEDPALSLYTAIGVFAAGYIVGLLALFAPGGVGVREILFVTLLAPSMGSGPALAVTVASRLLLTLMEVVAALAVVTLLRPEPREEDAVDAG